eukprot:jgi/Botrbrau1/2229/Bobra.101_2s0057.1
MGHAWVHQHSRQRAPKHKHAGTRLQFCWASQVLSFSGRFTRGGPKSFRCHANGNQYDSLFVLSAIQLIIIQWVKLHFIINQLYGWLAGLGKKGASFISPERFIFRGVLPKVVRWCGMLMLAASHLPHRLLSVVVEVGFLAGFKRSGIPFR